MSTDATGAGTPLLQPFPDPGEWLKHAYGQLHAAENGTATEKNMAGDPAQLARPWIPETCTDPRTRRDLWIWLDEAVIWLNSQYTWEPTELIPACWPEHPHLVRELAVLADQYRRARGALTSTPLEEWHRYTLSMFTERMRRRSRQHCDNGHKPTPGHGPQQRHQTHDGPRRYAAYRADVEAVGGPEPTVPASDNGHRRHLVVVDLETGVIEGETQH